MRTYFLQTLGLALLTACGRPAPVTPAVPPEPDDPYRADRCPDPALIPAGENAYLDRVRAQRAIWQARGPKDYVFVYTHAPAGVIFTTMLDVRTEVRAGAVVAASSLRYDGKPPETRTMDTLFDDLERIACMGKKRMPVLFETEFDPDNGAIRSLFARARNDYSDTENNIKVRCLSDDLSGCQPLFLRPEQCEAAGGRRTKVGDGGDYNYDIGRIAGESTLGGEGWDMCVRSFTYQGYDDISAAQCAAVDGVESGCEYDMLPVGGSHSRETGCCRRFVK